MGNNVAFQIREGGSALTRLAARIRTQSTKEEIL